MSDAPDIFLSYNREDAARARQFAEAFAAEGLDVWWDVALRSGEAYDEVTEAALRNAKAVVVLWSPRSVVSRWVRAEATLADRNKTLMPAMIEPCERPIMFELVQTAELSHWRGNTGDAAWRDFASHVREFVGKQAAVPVSARTTESLPRLDQLSIVVLPFSNLGKDEEQEYFADGITDDVITDLGKVSALSVIARNTAFTFKDQLVDVQKLASQLNVTHVLEGSVRRAGNRIRVNVQLIDGSTGAQVWSERWDRDLDDIFALQDELSQAIVAALKVKLLPGEKKAIEDRGTSSFEAYDQFMRAKAVADSAQTNADHKRAMALYRQALAIDPQFTAALSGIAQNAALAVMFGGELREIMQELDTLYDEAAARARHDPGVEALRGMRLALRLEWSEGFAALERAIAGSKVVASEVLHLYAWQLGCVGRVGDCARILEEALRSDPLSALLSTLLQMTYMSSGDMQRSRAEYLRGLDFAGHREDFQNNELFRVWMEGDWDETRAQFRRVQAVEVIGLVGINETFDVIHQPDKALDILRDAVNDPGNQHGTNMLVLATHIALHGDTQLAAETLRKSMFDYGFFTKMLMWQPMFAKVRQTETFRQMIRDLGIHKYWRTSGNWGDYARPLGDDDFEIIA